MDILNRLQNDEFDLACMRTDHLPKSFDCLTLCQDHLVAVLPQTHPLANRAEISLSDLQEEDFLCLGADTKLLETVQTACHNAGFAPHITYTGNRAENIMDMVANGRGIALIMEKIATYYAKDRVALGFPCKKKRPAALGWYVLILMGKIWPPPHFGIMCGSQTS